MFAPYMTLDVIVSTDSVGTRRGTCVGYRAWREAPDDVDGDGVGAIVVVARRAIRRSSNPTQSPVLSSRIGVTSACLTALRESVNTLKPATPNAMNLREGTESMSAIMLAS